jgi:hypothetical protein
MKKVFIVIAVFLMLLPSAGLEGSFFEKGITVREDSSELLPLPEKFSWRDINGTDFTTPVKNQAPAPTCEAYALVAAIETLMQYQAGYPFEPDLSEMHLYFYAGGTYEAGYVNLVDAANYLIEHGVPDEGCYPDPHRAYDYPFESLPGWENRTVKIREWGWVEHTEETIKGALIEHGPLIICAYFWKDFYYYHGGVYRHRWGRLAGGHVMTIAGYDDNDQCWIVKNSWGIEWGENGWFKMSYDAGMFADWYGEGTGIMYIDGVYGNFMPDVPKVYIEEPRRYHTYVMGREIPAILGRVIFQVGIPRVFGYANVNVNATNTERVEFYVDGEKQYVDDTAQFSWQMKGISSGMHTVEVLAYNEDGKISKDMVDVFVI